MVFSGHPPCREGKATRRGSKGRILILFLFFPPVGDQLGIWVRLRRSIQSSATITILPKYRQIGGPVERRCWLRWRCDGSWLKQTALPWSARLQWADLRRVRSSVRSRLSMSLVDVVERPIRPGRQPSDG